MLSESATCCTDLAPSVCLALRADCRHRKRPVTTWIGDVADRTCDDCLRLLRSCQVPSDTDFEGARLAEESWAAHDVVELAMMQIANSRQTVLTHRRHELSGREFLSLLRGHIVAPRQCATNSHIQPRRMLMILARSRVFWTVIGCFLRNGNVMRMTFSYTCR